MYLFAGMVWSHTGHEIVFTDEASTTSPTLVTLMSILLLAPQPSLLLLLLLLPFVVGEELAVAVVMLHFCDISLYALCDNTHPHSRTAMNANLPFALIPVIGQIM